MWLAFICFECHSAFTTSLPVAKLRHSWQHFSSGAATPSGGNEELHHPPPLQLHIDQYTYSFTASWFYRIVITEWRAGANACKVNVCILHTFPKSLQDCTWCQTQGAHRHTALKSHAFKFESLVIFKTCHMMYKGRNKQKKTLPGHIRHCFVTGSRVAF